jgi:hypothetical protein
MCEVRDALSYEKAPESGLFSAMIPEGMLAVVASLRREQGQIGKTQKPSSMTRSARAVLARDAFLL